MVCKIIYLFKLFIDEECKGLVKVVVDILGLHLLSDKIEHNCINAEVQFLHSFLTILSPVE